MAAASEKFYQWCQRSCEGAGTGRPARARRGSSRKPGLVGAWMHALTANAVLLLAASSMTVAAAERVEIELRGIEGEPAKNVRAALSVGRVDLTASGAEAALKRAHRQAEGEIERALEPFGHYRPKIQGELRREGGRWLARYSIEPGPKVRLRRVDVQIQGEGRALPELRMAMAEFPLQSGDALDHRSYERGKRRLTDTAADFGFFDARLLQHEIRVYLDRYVADLMLHLDSGPRYRFGAARFDSKSLDHDFLARYADFAPGAGYRADDVLALQQALAESGYFSRVDVTPRPEEAGDERRVPIDVSLTELPRHRYEAGIGFGTDTGIRARGGYQNRYVNRRGHQLRIEGQGSQIRFRALAEYLVPLAKPAREQLRYSAEAFRQDDDETGESTGFRVGVGRNKPRFGVKETASLFLQYELFDADGEDRSSLLLIPGISWSDSLADDPIYPRRGWRWELSLRGAAEGVLSDTSFLQARAGGKWVRGLWPNARLLTRGDLGATWVSDFTRLPTSLRFFTGGDNSVRGFDYNQLGSLGNGNGRDAGGQYLAVASLELEQLVWRDWGVAVFGDAGNAVREIDRFDLAYSVGVGLRWRSPVGLVRVDVAAAVSELDTPLRFHIVLGPDL